ncbi:hypothetical protein J1N35_011052 [Gossypium stocksii]|uniref:Uncharacterized protein n=1 Tax=Gossypium stocksii TaxID=47602 RepID=A0A9D3W1S4_9ROSI|nr:hypothetical protein J1N35_011052 [Gossypium stocksii]
MHPRKGFTLKESNYIDFMACIRQVPEALNWELFCEKRPSVDEELVHEFYTNLTSSELTEVLAREIKKTRYSQGTIIDWDLYRVVGDFILQQQVEKSKDPEEEEEDPTEIEPEAPDEAEPMEPEIEPDV